ncbi:Com family DNA-binding transcriptional regulator [Enterocloster bolteae]|nr:Com family DNA-binding transcriptional regulator [Enterocloster bolteae]
MTIEKITCTLCNKTLLYAEYVKGEIKCPRCGTVNKIKYNPSKGKSV